MKKLSIFTVLALLVVWGCKKSTDEGQTTPTPMQPTLLAPVLDAIIPRDSDVEFRWTPVIPKPRDPVNYRIKVWQLMQGQNGPEALKANQPIITKDVDNLTQIVVSKLITSPCAPPSTCNFIWNVQALNRDGKPIGGNNGTSEIFSFTVPTPIQTTLLAPVLDAIISPDSDVEFRWKSTSANSTTPITYKIKIVEITGDQSPEIALRTNKPHFEKDSLIVVNYGYPRTATKFIIGKSYGWHITAKQKGGTATGDNSPASGFKVK